HVHTEHPGQALEVGLRFGELLNVSVGNMREQNRQAAQKQRETGASALHANNGQSERPASAVGAAVATPPSPVQKAALQAVVVAVGDGLAEIFTSLGAARVVKGGQTMNPSTQEILEAVESVGDRKSTRLNSSHVKISYAVFCLKKKGLPSTGRG